MRRTNKDTEFVKDSILDMAITLFSQKGYDAINLQDIADALEMTRNPIYYHFKNKAKLYEEAVKKYLYAKRKKFDDIHNTKADFFEKLQKDLLLCTSLYKAETVLFFDSDKFPEIAAVQPFRQETFQHIYDLKKSIIEQGIRENILDKTIDIKETVNFIYVFYYGVGVMYSTDFHKLSDLDTRHLIDMIIEGLRARYGIKQKM